MIIYISDIVLLCVCYTDSEFVGLKILQKLAWKTGQIGVTACWVGTNDNREPRRILPSLKTVEGRKSSFPHLLSVCLPLYLFHLKLHNFNKSEVNCSPLLSHIYF